ncbi:MAG: ABC transporter substrate-binding protein [Actinomycetota bacterium]|nr:ABC transporter substrate-binding protein [Actinomycetota bacterium]
MKRRWTALVAIVALAIAGCSPQAVNNASKNGKGSDTLRLAFSDNPTGGIDPANFYNIEGEALILSVYEGLLRYAPTTGKLEGSLADSWKASSDLKTYTFHLRTGVRFQDGTKFDSKAVKTSFQREIDLATGPSYMVADIAQMKTPDRQTFIVRLKHPNNAFLDYMASMYGPKIISPKAISDNAQGNDLAKKWLASNAVGTGPYSLTSYQQDNRFVLQRFDGYWGPKANFKTVDIAVIPDIGAQQLQLEAGDLDMILHGISASQVPSLESNGVTVKSFDSVIRQIILINPHRAPFTSLRAREAFAAALNIPAAVNAIYGKYATVATSIYPKFTLPPGEAPVDYSSTATVPQGTPITITFPNVEPDLRRFAEYFQPELQKAGFKVTLKADTYSQEFGYYKNLKNAPNAIVSTFNPDAAHPDTWARLLWNTNGGLNLLGYSVPASDKAMNQAVVATSKARADRLYAKAGELMNDQRLIVMLSDAQDLFAVRGDITGVQHVPEYIWTVNLAALRRQ